MVHENGIVSSSTRLKRQIAQFPCGLIDQLCRLFSGRYVANLLEGDRAAKFDHWIDEVTGPARASGTLTH